MATPAGRRQALETLKSKGLSERATCRFAGVSRRVSGHEFKQPASDQGLEAQLIDASATTTVWLPGHCCDDGYKAESCLSTVEQAEAEATEA